MAGSPVRRHCSPPPVVLLSASFGEPLGGRVDCVVDLAVGCTQIELPCGQDERFEAAAVAVAVGQAMHSAGVGALMASAEAVADVAVDTAGHLAGRCPEVRACGHAAPQQVQFAPCHGELHRWLQVNGHDDRWEHMQPTDGGVQYGSEAEFG